ncbi:hypothetical protein A2U01_0068697, partial [Trifolium medium]|nr:hypothetical protein [Trifolium medium]
LKVVVWLDFGDGVEDGEVAVGMVLNVVEMGVEGG